MPTRKLIEAVDGLPRVAFEGTSYRHLARGYLPLTGEGARIHGGRWNPPGSFSVLYTALDRATVVAELERSARRQGLSIRDFLPRDEVTYTISLQRVLDLGVASNRAALGLERSDIVGLDWAPCEAVGEAAHYVGFEALLAPSSTSTGQALALFLGRLVIGSRVDVESVEDLTVDGYRE